MKLEEGIYVRTDYGSIGKIIEKYKGVSNAIIYKIDVPEDGFNYTNVFDFTIKNASFNIIDLIEVGDYVNGYKVTLICEDEVHPQNKCLRLFGRSYTWQKDIKSIVTKEQFESMKYKVGD